MRDRHTSQPATEIEGELRVAQGAREDGRRSQSRTIVRASTPRKQLVERRKKLLRRRHIHDNTSRLAAKEPALKKPSQRTAPRRPSSGKHFEKEHMTRNNPPWPEIDPPATSREL